MLEQIYPYLILSGLTIGFVLLYLWRQALAVNRLNLALINLNQEQEYDTLRFLYAAWPILSQAKIRGLAWQLQWFGIALNGQAGKCGGEYIERQIEVGEMRIHLHIHLHSRRSEQAYFTDTVLATLMLLLRTDMLIKAGSIHSTLTQMEKLNVFLLHDIKNIAQFIQLMSDQLQQMQEHQEKLVLGHLRAAAPMVRQRADRIVQTLTANQDLDMALVQIDLAAHLQQSAHQFSLPLQVEGNAKIWFPARNLDCALENILKNYHDVMLRTQQQGPQQGQPIQPDLRACISHNAEGVQVSLCDHAATAPVALERLFEPFWSSDPSGLGIGLYQAKQMLETGGGRLCARHNEKQQLEFIMHLPPAENVQHFA